MAITKKLVLSIITSAGIIASLIEIKNYILSDSLPLISFFNSLPFTKSGFLYVTIILLVLATLKSLWLPAIKRYWTSHVLTKQEKEELDAMKYWLKHLSRLITWEEYRLFVEEGKELQKSNDLAISEKETEKEEKEKDEDNGEINAVVEASLERIKEYIRNQGKGYKAVKIGYNLNQLQTAEMQTALNEFAGALKENGQIIVIYMNRLKEAVRNINSILIFNRNQSQRMAELENCLFKYKELSENLILVFTRIMNQNKIQIEKYNL